jgi:UDP-glucose 6-dehydrogenase
MRLIAARHPQADIHVMLDALGSDSRIGKKYLRADLSYGPSSMTSLQPPLMLRASTSSS